MLLAVDFHEDFINKEGIAVAPVFSFQPARINSTELIAPQADRLAGDGDATLGKKIFDIAVA